MAQKHEIHVEIDENGEMTLEVKGVKGEGCTKILDDLMRAIGIKANGPATHTAEYREREKATVKAGR